MGDCAFKSCHTASATASGVVAAAAAAVTGITFAAKPAGEEVLAKIWHMGARAFKLFFPHHLLAAACANTDTLKQQKRKDRKLKENQEIKYKLKQKIPIKPESSINACFRICVDNEQY